MIDLVILGGMQHFRLDAAQEGLGHAGDFQETRAEEAAGWNIEGAARVPFRSCGGTRRQRQDAVNCSQEPYGGAGLLLAARPVHVGVGIAADTRDSILDTDADGLITHLVAREYDALERDVRLGSGGHRGLDVGAECGAGLSGFEAIIVRVGVRRQLLPFGIADLID